MQKELKDEKERAILSPVKKQNPRKL